MDDLETYNGQIARLDLDYVRFAGEALRARLFPRPGMRSSPALPNVVSRYLELLASLPSGDHRLEEQIQKVREAVRPVETAAVSPPVTLAYQPSNGTNYPLVFTPVRSLQSASGEVNADGATWSVPEGCYERDGTAREGYVIVARIGADPAFAYPFDLSFGSRIHTSYVAEHTPLNFADAAALTALLRSITGVALLDSST